jgi:hypothetical protein
VEKKMSKKLLLILAVFFLLAQFQVFVVQKEIWFDTAFSLETAHKINSEGSPKWTEFDVHYPIFYFLLAGWQKLNLGLSEFQWAQQLTILASLGFIYFSYKFLQHLFGDKIAFWSALAYASLSTTLLHFAIEPRSYIFVLLSASIAAYSAVTFKLHRFHFVFHLSILPMFHYFAVVAWPFLLLINFVAMRADKTTFKDWLKSHIWTFISVVVSLSLVLYVAYFQRIRSEGTWFQFSSLNSFPSALSYSTFLFDNLVVATSDFLRVLYYLFLLCVVVAFVHIYKNHERIKNSKYLMIMLSTAILPFLVLFALSFCRTGGFCNLYHHRFFLAATWMFALAVFTIITILVLRSGKQIQISVLILLALIAVASQITYSESVHYELKRTIYNTPCETALIGHESPFSLLPYKVYQRELGCDWMHFVSTNISVRRSRTAGFDILSSEEVYWNLTVPEKPYYFVLSDSSIVEHSGVLGDFTIIHQDDGIRLVYVT